MLILAVMPQIAEKHGNYKPAVSALWKLQLRLVDSLDELGRSCSSKMLGFHVALTGQYGGLWSPKL